MQASFLQELVSDMSRHGSSKAKFAAISYIIYILYPQVSFSPLASAMREDQAGPIRREDLSGHHIFDLGLSPRRRLSPSLALSGPMIWARKRLRRT